MFAFARMSRVKNIAALKNVERHGRREDESSRRRADLTKTANNFAWSAVENDPLDVVGAYKKRKADTGAQEYKGASVALHFLIGVSPEWIAESGDVHDPKNPRNKALFTEARKWSEKTFGAGSTVAARMDLDEAGSGIVDLVVVPVAEVKQRGKIKNQVSVKKGLESAFGRCKSYVALQDSWSKHAQQTLSPDLMRGKPKSETQREHVHADILRPALQRAEAAEKAAKLWRADAEKWRSRSAEMQKKIEAQQATIAKHEAEIAGFRRGFLGKFATAREADLKEKTEQIQAVESAKNDDLLLRAQRAEGSLQRARDERDEARQKLHRQEEKYGLITGEISRTFPGAAREIRELERDFETYKASHDGGGVPTQEAGIQHDDDEAIRNLKIAVARESAVNARNSAGPSM